MSDFIEMTNCLLKHQDQTRRRRRRFAVWSVGGVAVLSLGLGMWQAYSDLTRPVGSVSSAFCQNTPCTTFVLELNPSR